MRATRLIWIIALLVSLTCGELAAQRGGARGGSTARSGSGSRTGSPAGRSGARANGRPGPRGTEGQSTARGRALAEGERIQREERRRGDGDGGGGSQPAPPDAGKRSEAERARFLKTFFASVEKTASEVRDAAVDYDLMLLPSGGRPETLSVSHRYKRLSARVRRHRLSIFRRTGVRRLLVEDLILHEIRGVRINAWQRKKDGSFVPLGRPALSLTVAGTPLTVEALLPFDHTRYKARYEGRGFRDGRNTEIFSMKPRLSGSSRLEVGYLVKEQVPCRWRPIGRRASGWGAVATRPRIRDGRHVLERRSIEFRKGGSAVMKVKARAVNKGLDPALFEPRKD